MVVEGELFGAFSVREGLEAGMSRRRLRGRGLDAPFWGMREPSGPRADSAEELLLARCRAYLAVAPERAVFSHVTAARLWGMALPSRLERSDELHMQVPGRAVRRAGIVGHATSVLEAHCAQGLPVVPAAAAWIQVAGQLAPDELVIAADSLVRRVGPPSSIAQLAERVESARGERGVAACREALAHVRAGTDSPAESRVRLILVRAGLPEPVVGHTVSDDGYWVGRPDLAYPRHRVAIEYQGDGHRQREVFEDDIDRLERFHAAGWAVVQATRRDIQDPRELLHRTRAALHRARSS